MNNTRNSPGATGEGVRPGTPLPWEIDGKCIKKWHATDHQFYPEGGYRTVIVTMRKEEDARYIVHACNSYPALVEALQLTEKVLEHAYTNAAFTSAHVHGMRPPEGFSEAVNAANAARVAALTLARGEA